MLLPRSASLIQDASLTPLQTNTRDAYIKNYTFDYDFGAPWGHSSVTMTAVKGHLTAVEFPADFKQWEYPPPDRLFDAPVLTVVPNVRHIDSLSESLLYRLTPK